MMLKNEAPIKSPKRPPQLATKSVTPYSSERVKVINSFSLKNISNLVGINLKCVTSFRLNAFSKKKTRQFLYSADSFFDTLNVFEKLFQSNGFCDISASYVIELQAGKQLQGLLTLVGVILAINKLSRTDW